jgi:hypothetical protein
MPNVDLSQLVTAADKAATVQAARAAGVNAERARRLEVGGVLAISGYGSVAVQGRDQDVANMANLGLAAQARIAAMSSAPFQFRAADNVVHVLTPEQMFALWQGSLALVERVYAASWTLKDGASIPADFADDAHWPEMTLDV